MTGFRERTTGRAKCRAAHEPATARTSDIPSVPSAYREAPTSTFPQVKRSTSVSITTSEPRRNPERASDLRVCRIRGHFAWAWRPKYRRNTAGNPRERSSTARDGSWRLAWRHRTVGASGDTGRRDRPAGFAVLSRPAPSRGGAEHQGR